VNFYISLEKRENCDISMVYLHKIWQDNVSKSCLSSALHIKNFILKINKTADIPERPVLHHHEVLQFFDFQDGSSLPSWNFEIKNFNILALRSTL